MNKEDIGPVIEIIEFDDSICTSGFDEVEAYGSIQESSNGWLTWI